MFRLRRRLKSRCWCCSRCSGRATCSTRLRRALALFAPACAAFKRRGRKTFARSRWRWLLRPHELVRRVYRLQAAKATRVLRLRSGFAVAPGRGRAPGLPFPRSNGDGEPPNEGACCCTRNHATSFAARTRRNCWPAIRIRWTCPRSRRRASCLARGSTSWRRNILWIFGFDFLFQFRLVRHALPAVLDLWLCNLRLHRWRFRG